MWIWGGDILEANTVIPKEGLIEVESALALTVHFDSSHDDFCFGLPPASTHLASICELLFHCQRLAQT